MAERTEVQSISEEDFERAQKTFQSGKKNLFLSKYDEAVSNIGEACKVYSDKFGEFDSQCADVYFYYGKSLLELARVENTVLGNALTGVLEETGPIDDSRYGNPEDINDEEKEEIAEKVMDALCGDGEEKKEENSEKPEGEKDTETKEEVKPAEVEEASAEKTEETQETGEDQDQDDEEDTEEKNDTEKEEDADDISNLQRSWEMFELAKLVYSKNFNDDLTFKNKRISECLLKLGEISIEQESYEQALVDIGESIRMQEELSSEQRDERMLAETYYQFGLAQQFSNQLNEANESYKKSINIVQLRIEKLNGKLAQIGEGADAELERNTINEEIKELEVLLPEMNAKLEEVNEQGKETENLIKEAKECFMNSVEDKLGQATTDGEVKDITGLVKSKRKISASDESVGVKKTRLSGANEEQTPVQEENKQMETEINKENVPMAETTEAPVEKIAVDEPAATEAPAEEQPMPTA